TVPEGTAIPYPAGLVRISGAAHDELLVANNLSDNVILLDAVTGKILQRFDLSANDLVPSSFPYTCAAGRDGKRAWCSLWNLGRIAELDLAGGKIARWITLADQQDPIAPGPHPTALLLSPNEDILYAALSNADEVAAVSTGDGKLLRFFTTDVRSQN